MGVILPGLRNDPRIGKILLAVSMRTFLKEIAFGSLRGIGKTHPDELVSKWNK